MASHVQPALYCLVSAIQKAADPFKLSRLMFEHMHSGPPAQASHLCGHQRFLSLDMHVDMCSDMLPAGNTCEHDSQPPSGDVPPRGIVSAQGQEHRNALPPGGRHGHSTLVLGSVSIHHSVIICPGALVIVSILSL